jgi:hypothetical protein
LGLAEGIGTGTGLPFIKEFFSGEIGCEPECKIAWIIWRDSRCITQNEEDANLSAFTSAPLPCVATEFRRVFSALT